LIIPANQQSKTVECSDGTPKRGGTERSKRHSSATASEGFVSTQGIAVFTVFTAQPMGITQADTQI
jgi:hypothetical protein